MEDNRAVDQFTAYDHIEPVVKKLSMPVEDSTYSIAISLKRIADAVENGSTEFHNMLYNSLSELIIAIRQQ